MQVDQGRSTGRLDRRAAEALALELRMLAKIYGLGVEAVEIRESMESSCAARRTSRTTGSRLIANKLRRKVAATGNPRRR